MQYRVATLLVALLIHAVAFASPGDDQSAIESLLRTFLAGTAERATHERFWSEDLIYTSSSGARYGKAEILARFEDGTAAERYTPAYGAEDVTVRLFGDVAVVTFRLIADQDGQRIAEYFNTGVFRRGDVGWRAFTWQATRIPGD